MRSIENLIEQRFGRLTVIARAPAKLSGGEWRACWSCHCDCGASVNVLDKSLRAGLSHSCGCWKRENAAARLLIHGQAHRGRQSGAYRSWSAMMNRCTNPNSPQFHDYGGRGIDVDSGLRTFEGFYAVLGDRPEGMTLDRIDNSRGYEPGNVQWATLKQQARNQRTNRLLTFRGRTQSAASWCEELGIPWSRLKMRLKRDWSIEKALSV